ncbi:MAG: protein kinase [Myxococcales bacterium]
MNTASRGDWRGRLSDVLGSPPVLALSVLALVTLVGSTSTYMTYRALRRQGEARAESDLRKNANEVRLSIDFALGAADTLLNRLQALVEEFAPTTAPFQLLARMRELSVARAGLARISVSLPDGTHLAIRRDDQWVPYAEIVRQTEHGAIREEYTVDPMGKLQRTKLEQTDYDPRTRPYYEIARVRASRAWTPPYLFLPTFETGVTRVQPLFGDPLDPRRISAVLTVDFDTAGIEALLSAPLTPSERRLVVDSWGGVLAASGLRMPRPRDRARRDSVHWRELPDPVLHAALPYFSALSDGASRTFEVAGQAYRISRASITKLDRDPISLATVSAEAELFHAARREAMVGMVTTAFTAIGGVLLALLLSENIARLRRKRVEAELGEKRAREELEQLGSYELVALIRRGGMGEVHRARHRLLARDAALKLIRSRSEDEARIAQEQRQFLLEARALASLHSVHTVALYDFGIANDGRYFLAMELLDGCDLQELVTRFGPQPATRVANILAQICDSLKEAHAMDLVHRDLKPANVFLCRQAEWLDLVKVLDFGLTVRSGYAEGKHVSGTPGYMAPEQALGERVTVQADLYALGCVGFWLLSAELPFGSGTSEKVLRRELEAEVPELPESVRATAPVELTQLITRCMARDPAHRPVSAELLGRALRRIANADRQDFDEEALRAFWRAHESRASSEFYADETVPAVIAVRRQPQP